MTAIANVAPNTTILSAWGNSVADEANLRTLKIDGLRSSDGAPMQMTGDLWLRNADPTNPNHAARKAYVDATLAAKLDTAGGTLTGTLVINPSASDLCLLLRSQMTGSGGAFTNSPYLAFYNAQQTVRFGYLQGTPAGVNLVAESGAANIQAATNIALNAGGAVRASSAFYAAGQGRFAAAAQQVMLIGATPYLAFYDGSTVDNIGDRSGFIGYSDGYLNLYNQRPAGSIIHNTAYSHAFKVGAKETCRIVDGSVMVGKTASGIANQGVELFESGSIYATRPATGNPPAVLNRIASADGAHLLEVCRSNVLIGRIEQEGTTGSKYVSGSDRRMKTIRGDITDGTERIMAMKAYRVSWNGDPSRGITDAFIADEMMGIVPEAVSGTPNAVAGKPTAADDPPEGTPLMQGMSYEKLIPVAIAALQDTIRRVQKLEAA